ncbi:hypothetical protein BDV40DRAFT_302335 [Aspergillus tamarii]|uniref:Fungal-type protein kinase domain-containing protein n=1 Tax=Aspergillus tamarii TaxID=41984 RepID=A0A5N6UP41_ASPTM|nr:hypothetical protein BDV40DRAFT_302335 [Aspergillus tamarii]
MSLQDLELVSGSRVNKAQFLLMRILCKPHEPEGFDPTKWGLERFADAQAILQDTPEFQRYLKSIQDDAPTTTRSPDDPFPLGLFEIPRCHQRYVQQIGTRTSLKLSSGHSDRKEASDAVPTSDEIVVTFAAIDNLHAVCPKTPGVYSQWTASCYSFQALGEEGFQARTDGVLHLHEEPEKVYALLDCKARRREDVLPQVQYQEAAQIVAWILQKNHPETAMPGRIFLISHNRSEITLTFGTLDRHYRNFLLGKTCASRFLTLYEYGPFLLDDASNTEQVACIVLAFVLGVGKGR